MGSEGLQFGQPAVQVRENLFMHAFLFTAKPSLFDHRGHQSLEVTRNGAGLLLCLLQPLFELRRLLYEFASAAVQFRVHGDWLDAAATLFREVEDDVDSWRVEVSPGRDRQG